MQSVYSAALADWATGHSLVGGGSYLSAEMQSVFSAPLADQAIGHFLGKGLTPLQRCSQCILQPKPTGPQDILWGRVLPLCRDVVGVFCSPSRLGHRTFFGGGSYLSAEMSSVFSAPLADQARGHFLGGGLTPLQRCSQCILQPQPTGPQDILWGGVLPLCRDVVGVFCTLSRLGHRTFLGEGSNSSAEMQSVYSAAQADWATGHSLGEGLTSLQRCSRCILQPQPTEPLDILWGRVLPLCRDVVGVFCTLSRLGQRTFLGGGSNSSAEMQSVYSAALADWATGHSLVGGLTSLQRCSRCFLHPQPTRPQDISWGRV